MLFASQFDAVRGGRRHGSQPQTFASGAALTLPSMSRFDTYCPECGDEAHVLLRPAPLLFKCRNCGARTPVDELVYVKRETLLKTLRGAPLSTAITVEFLGEVLSTADQSVPSLSLSGVSLTKHDLLLVAYLTELITFGGNPTATWNGETVGNAGGLQDDAETSVADFPLFTRNLYLVVHSPTTPGIGTLTVTEPGDPSARILSAFIMRGARSIYTHASIDNEDGPSISFSFTPNASAELYVLVSGARDNTTSGQWSGADRVRVSTDVGTNHLVDLATSAKRNPFVATYSNFAAGVEAAGIVMGFSR